MQETRLHALTLAALFLAAISLLVSIELAGRIPPAAPSMLAPVWPFP